MNHFPFMAPVSEVVIKAIENLSRTKFNGAMLFVYFSAHGADKKPAAIKTIGTESTYLYNSRGIYRFPPLITNLEVKPTGTMGVVREGSVTIKFASIQQMQDPKYVDFFRIGTGKTITWGWNQNRITGNNFNLDPPSETNSKLICNNIDEWQKFLKKNHYGADILVGPLINFSFTLNNDASVDVVFTVGSPNELIAYMGSHKEDASSSQSSDENNISAYRVAALLNLTNGDFTGGTASEFETYVLPNLINYKFSTSTFAQMWANVASFFSSGEASNTLSEDVYINFDAIVKYVLNQRKGAPLGTPGSTPTTGSVYEFDISEAVSVASKNMISNSENVIFCNIQMANPRIIGNELVLDTVNTQAFSVRPNGLSYPETVVLKRPFKNADGGTIDNEIDPYKWGYVKNAFFKVDFVQDIVKNNGDGNIVDIVEKLCNEINIASCGLTDLAPQETSTSKERAIWTIVDYNLIGKITKEKKEIPTLSLFESGNKRSTITNISFNCDLPKEIAAMTMLGNRKGNDVGKGLFFTHIEDTVLAATKKNGYVAPPPVTAAAGTPTPPKIDESCIFIKMEPTEQFSGANNPERTKAVFKNTDMLKSLYFGTTGADGYNQKNPLLPIELEITVIGISGIIAGQVLQLESGTLPFNQGGIFQVKEVNHTVAGNKWETIIKLGYRPDN